MARLLFSALFLLLTTLLFAYNDALGSVSLVEGHPTISRNQRNLASKELDFGTVLQNFDVIRTPKGAKIEIDLDPSTGIDGTLVIRENSTALLNISGMGASISQNVSLVDGSVECRIRRVNDATKFSLAVGSAIVQTQASTFAVTFSTTGDLLIDVLDGIATCTTSDSRLFEIKRGTTVSSNFSGTWKTEVVSIDRDYQKKLSDLERSWSANALQVYKAHPKSAILSYAEVYLSEVDVFNKLYQDLVSERDLLNKWIRQDQLGNDAPAQDLPGELARISKVLLPVKKLAVQFERVFERIKVLDLLYAQGISASGRVGVSTMSVSDFFTEFRAQKAGIAAKLLELDYVSKLFALRNHGSLILDQAATLPDLDPVSNWVDIPVLE